MDAAFTYTETELVILLKQGKTAAYAYLYDRYAGALYSVILGIIQDEVTSTDVLQDTLVKIWQNIHSFDPDKGRLFTWMHRIARNKSLDTIRSKYYQNSRLMNPIADHVMELASSDQGNHYGLREIITHLKDEHRILIELSYIQGYTQEEIAQQLNIPLGTVKTRLREAFAILRKELSKMI
ncbi:RNA polymerase sigma factor [Chitinophaga sp. LS1]|uniref:RNA polymerase sigma factor n=1 Tax=Chitinophaga sp. LS1 TaxID=3051176 RepID=UPI002AAAA495|nr:sigma-70 family RNA polymerase sigma factor [Chitinophaga sp. LS1]WPV65352.1 sigma-70 family RNA polymerase sigma factor [Chitinophaga sp. LS1]